MIYLLTAIELTPGGRSTVHIYTQTHKQYTEQHKTNNTQNNTKQKIHRTTQFWKSAGRAPHCRFYPGICLTTEEKARKNHIEGSRMVPAGTMKIHKRTIRIQTYNKNTSMSPAGFEPAIPARERRQTHTLDRVAITITNTENVISPK